MDLTSLFVAFFCGFLSCWVIRKNKYIFLLFLCRVLSVLAASRLVLSRLVSVLRSGDVLFATEIAKLLSLWGCFCRRPKAPFGPPTVRRVGDVANEAFALASQLWFCVLHVVRLSETLHTDTHTHTSRRTHILRERERGRERVADLRICKYFCDNLFICLAEREQQQHDESWRERRREREGKRGQKLLLAATTKLVNCNAEKFRNRISRSSHTMNHSHTRASIIAMGRKLCRVHLWES